MDRGAWQAVYEVVELDTTEQLTLSPQLSILVPPLGPGTAK